MHKIQTWAGTDSFIVVRPGCGDNRGLGIGPDKLTVELNLVEEKGQETQIVRRSCQD